ncbi:MAG: hypothetical protein BWY82_01568 [Verrucomicrobia bacterium ADurb.Bin474]|nr:MAG: hypothetical protein BWY82_01568 [Verrucomicrobia bacterium ADurb.Bin474]
MHFIRNGVNGGNVFPSIEQGNPLISLCRKTDSLEAVDVPVFRCLKLAFGSSIHVSGGIRLGTLGCDVKLRSIRR